MIERIPFDRFANTAVQYRDHFFCPQKSSQNQYLDVCIIVHTYILYNSSVFSRKLPNLKSLIKHGVFLIPFENYVHALLEPPRLLISEKSAINSVFM